MPRLYTQSEATAARRRFPVFLVDAADGLTPETGEAGGQPQLSKVGGAWANTTATLTAVGNGHYSVELTAAELDTLGYFAIRYKSAATAEFNMDGQVIAANLYDAADFGLSTLTTLLSRLVGTIAAGTHVAQTGDSFARLGAPAGASVSADVLVIDNLVDDLESRLGTPSNLGSGATVAANLADIEGQTNDIGVAGAGLTAIPGLGGDTPGVTTLLTRVPGIVQPQTGDSFARLGAPVAASISADIATRATPAQVNTEVLDVLNTDTFAEPGQETPPATTTLVKKIGYLYKYLINRIVQTSTEADVYNNTDTVIDHKAVVSDSGLTFTRNKFLSGP